MDASTEAQAFQYLDPCLSGAQLSCLCVMRQNVLLEEISGLLQEFYEMTKRLSACLVIIYEMDFAPSDSLRKPYGGTVANS